MQETDELLLETCLLAGKIMMENGSEVYRVEDTMNRIAANAGEANSISYVTATGIFMGLRSSHYAQVENVHDRVINLEKIVAVNRLSRSFAEKQITLPHLYASLKEINQVTPSFPLWLQVLSAGVVSSTLMIIFGGNWSDFIVTFFIGSIGFITGLWVKKAIDIRFLDMFVASLVIGCLAILSVRGGLAGNVDNLIIGAVMPLVPGVAITNSFRDILAGHLISGTARGTEAIFTAAAIGVGIATVFTLFWGLS
ncbi:threonine/serine exporter family protein [Enterococcus gallinarum]|uniref:threonine/serine exporter family protein n=1 Tax=Enterococcus gallinarum TaxID=1353 RepID=UPI0029552524|nr:threonine/serine exporter family protein [Enterococcus gallinarum]MDV7823680.1 threonine/serine exporter family protein [Enterococcus gallinarum]